MAPGGEGQSLVEQHAPSVAATVEVEEGHRAHGVAQRFLTAETLLPRHAASRSSRSS